MSTLGDAWASAERINVAPFPGDESPAVAERAMMLAIVSEAFVRAGEPDRASCSLSQALEYAREELPPADHLKVLVAIAKAQGRAGDTARASRRYSKALKCAEAIDGLEARVRICLDIAHAQDRIGLDARASHAFARAFAVVPRFSKVESRARAPPNGAPACATTPCRRSAANAWTA